MKTTAILWSDYLRLCYPEGISGTQLNECRQAFYSGAFALLKLITNEVSALPEDKGCEELDKLEAELTAYYRTRISEATKKN